MLSLAEENHLKAIWHLSDAGKRAVTTTELAGRMKTKPASVTDMMKKLSAKKLIRYERYHGVSITERGATDALSIIRKHRLWETFLVEKLGFRWHEVHEVAEQLEHVQSKLLVDRLDDFLGNPSADPHGHSIPDRDGKFRGTSGTPLSEIISSNSLKVLSIRNGAPDLLQFLTRIGIYIGASIEVTERRGFDGSMEVRIDGGKATMLSREVTETIVVNN